MNLLRIIIRKLTRIEGLLLHLNFRSLYIMATKEEVKAAAVALKDHITTETTQVQAKLTALTDQVTELKAQIEAGTAASPSDLDDILAAIKEASTGVANIVEPLAEG